MIKKLVGYLSVCLGLSNSLMAVWFINVSCYAFASVSARRILTVLGHSFSAVCSHFVGYCPFRLVSCNSSETSIIIELRVLVYLLYHGDHRFSNERQCM